MIVLSSSSLAAAPPRFLFPLFNDIAASLALLTCPCTALVHSAQSEHGQGAWGSDLHCQQKVWPAVQDALARSGSIVRSLQVEPLRFTTQVQEQIRKREADMKLQLGLMKNTIAFALYVDETYILQVAPPAHALDTRPRTTRASATVTSRTRWCSGARTKNWIMCHSQKVCGQRPAM